jgi:hypothetical protein
MDDVGAPNFCRFDRLSPTRTPQAEERQAGVGEDDQDEADGGDHCAGDHRRHHQVRTSRIGAP